MIGNRSLGNTGCPGCNGDRQLQRCENHEEFVRKSGLVHGDKYTYPEQYVNNKTKVGIFCPVLNANKEPHGIFHQRPNGHKKGRGCQLCDKGFAQQLGGHEEFLRRAIEIHGDKYTYPEKYTGCITKINIHCAKVGKDGKEHGLFLKDPHMHIGQRQGCMKCTSERKESAKVSEVKAILSEIGYIENVTMFSEWLDEERLRDKGPLKMDKLIRNGELIVPENLFEETDGGQHFREGGYRGSRQDFIDSLRRDFLKDQYCLLNGYSIVRIPYNLKNCRFWLELAISMCKAGQRVYFSYKDFHNEIIKYMPIPAGYLVAFIDCPALKFREPK